MVKLLLHSGYSSKGNKLLWMALLMSGMLLTGCSGRIEATPPDTLPAQPGKVAEATLSTDTIESASAAPSSHFGTDQSTLTLLEVVDTAPLEPAPVRFLESVHPLATNLIQRGAVDCAPRAQQLMNLLSNGDDITLLQLPSDNAQQSLASVSVLFPAESERVRLALLALAPGQANGCGASFHAIQVFSRLCPLVIATDHPDRAFQAMPAARAWLSSLGEADLLIAIELNPGCLLIRQQLVQ